MVQTGWAMSFQIANDADVIRQTIRRVAISTGISFVMTAATLTMSYAKPKKMETYPRTT